MANPLKAILYCATTGLMATTATAAYADDPPDILHERVIPALPEQVWQAFTTSEGAATFFSRKAVIDPRVDGEYSILFFPDNPPGKRGAENMRILAIEPDQHRLVYTWNSPANYAHTRNQRAVVEVELSPAGDNATRVKLRHFAFGDTHEWQQIRDYFDGAWTVVLNRLEYRFENGPIDWDHVSEIEGLTYSGPDKSESSR